MSELKFADAEQTRLVGLLAPYGGLHNGRDIAGEYFSAKTNFCLDWYTATRPLLYHHGLDADADVKSIGDIQSVKATEAGIWMEAQLNKEAEYYEAIRDLVNAGKLGLSSGAMSHLVKVDAKTGHIDRWPLVEGSLTPTPCNILARVDIDTAKAHYKSAGLDSALLDHAPVETKAADAPEGSYEDRLDDIREALNPKTPWAMGGYTAVIATFADHVLVCRYDYDQDEQTYWDIPYTYENDTVVLGTAVEVEQTYVPAAKAASTDSPLSLDATSLSRHAAALHARTEALHQRRVKEGRVLSVANRRLLADAADGMETAAKAVRDLLDTTDRLDKEAAKAAYLATPEAQQVELDLLQLAYDAHLAAV